MSLGGPTSCPRACSGDMNPGDPKSVPENPSPSPNPVTRGPSSASRTFEGLRSRCTSPASWIARRPEASPAASTRTLAAGTGPWSRTASAIVGPATYAVASHGSGASRSAAITGVVNAPLTRRAAATSVRNRGSAATSARITRTATRSPLGARPTNNPLPPSGSTSLYGPIVPDVNGTTTLNPHSQWQLQPFPVQPFPGNRILSRGHASEYARAPAATAPAKAGTTFSLVVNP
jgi:hypothetical protein